MEGMFRRLVGWDTLIPTVLLVSISGVLAPGPLFFATVTHGLKGGARSGFLVAMGHMLFELPLVLAIASGLLMILDLGSLRLAIGALGSAAIIIFGALQVLDSLKRNFNASRSLRMPASALIVGLAFTGLNPLFIVWWMSIGMNLIMESLLLASLVGVLAMYFSHVWMDYAWLTFVAYMAGKTSSIMSGRWMRALVLCLGLTLIGLGIFLLTSLLLA